MLKVLIALMTVLIMTGCSEGLDSDCKVLVVRYDGQGRISEMYVSNWRDVYVSGDYSSKVVVRDSKGSPSRIIYLYNNISVFVLGDQTIDPAKEEQIIREFVSPGSEN